LSHFGLPRVEVAVEVAAVDEVELVEEAVDARAAAEAEAVLAVVRLRGPVVVPWERLR